MAPYFRMLMLAGLAAPAFAQTQDQNWLRCKDFAPRIAIEGCNAVMAAGTESEIGVADAFKFRGFAYIRAGNPAQALADFAQASRLDPTELGPVFGHGVALYHLGRFGAALQDLDRVIAANPRYAEAVYVRGLVRRHMGDLAGSDADFEAATGMHDNVTRTVFELGVRP